MLAVLSITAPIFILIGLGFVSVRGGLVNREQLRGMGTFVITFALPALVFNALAKRPLSEVLNVPYMGAYALGSLAIFAIGFAVAFWLRRQGVSRSAIMALGVSVSNSGFIGYPIALTVLGEQAAVALALGMLVENLLLIPLALALAEAGTQRGSGGWALLRETGLRIGRLRYFASQPWPFPHALMLGYQAEYEAGEIICAPDEIEDARFFHVDALPAVFPTRYAMANLLLRDFCLLDAGGKGQDAFIIIGFGILGLSFGQAGGALSPLACLVLPSLLAGCKPAAPRSLWRFRGGRIFFRGTKPDDQAKRHRICRWGRQHGLSKQRRSRGQARSQHNGGDQRSPMK